MQFTALANRVQGIMPEALLVCFIGGLKSDIRRDVIAQAPTTLIRTVSLAKLYEEKYVVKPRSYPSQPWPKTHNHPNSLPISQSIKSTSLPPLLPSPNQSYPTNNLKPTNVKKMTPAEMHIRREKGLCYTCDERFTLNHRCPNKQYLLLYMDDDDLNELQPDPPDSSAPTDIENSLDHHLSYNALKGSCGLGTMKFQGSINGMHVQILLDSSSFDNFQQPRLAHCLKLPVEPIPNLQVLVGNGNSFVVEGLVEELEVKIQGHSFKLPVYLLPVTGEDLVLGAAWLAIVGPHISDYSKLTLKFYLNNHFITLYGEQPKLPTHAQFTHLRRMHNTHAIAELFTLHIQQPDSPQDRWLDLPTDMEPEMALLLHTYKEVFSIPSGLPPPRAQNHSIPLIQGSGPIKVKPYRYPHSQKFQIESTIHDMLREGIIVPSTSPFSSPIVLVKKKDDTWRFCTNYRALNAITVKDSFPIPTVDELIDELHGAQYFSKLDLRSGYHQILVKEEDRHKTAFRTHQGLYEWLVMPFGLSNAPATFQSLMNEVFQGLLRKYVLVFFDDILVYSPSWDLHLHHLEVVLKLLLQHRLFAWLSKCSFGLQQIDYLDHTISGQGVAMDKDKVKAVLDWPVLANLK